MLTSGVVRLCRGCDQATSCFVANYRRFWCVVVSHQSAYCTLSTALCTLLINHSLLILFCPTNHRYQTQAHRQASFLTICATICCHTALAVELSRLLHHCCCAGRLYFIPGGKTPSSSSCCRTNTRCLNSINWNWSRNVLKPIQT